jgi:hypothetical protein
MNLCVDLKLYLISKCIINNSVIFNNNIKTNIDIDIRV